MLEGGFTWFYFLSCAPLILYATACSTRHWTKWRDLQIVLVVVRGGVNANASLHVPALSDCQFWLWQSVTAQYVSCSWSWNRLPSPPSTDGSFLCVRRWIEVRNWFKCLLNWQQNGFFNFVLNVYIQSDASTSRLPDSSNPQSTTCAIKTNKLLFSFLVISLSLSLSFSQCNWYIYRHLYKEYKYIPSSCLFLSETFLSLSGLLTL